jgi:hypothetical protein
VSDEEKRLMAIWSQTKVPVVLRRSGKGQQLRVRLPFADDNREWLRNDRRHRPEWDKVKKHWELPKTWFNNLVERALDRYGSVYIVQPYREQEKCAPACMNATGHECQCSCMGANHGMGNDGSWFEVSDTFAVRSGGLHLASRLLTRKKDR